MADAELMAATRRVAAELQRVAGVQLIEVPADADAMIKVRYTTAAVRHPVKPPALAGDDAEDVIDRGEAESSTTPRTQQ
ncbi:hypothetical protein [Acuticoccus sp.]|uniref:hypothetical protein n=1 Tax=Acuticoccus sp. TaxID=1904378 RepID=UPI003B52D724